MGNGGICVVGAGLMGGSLVLALRPFFPYLAVVDTNPDTRLAVAQVADLVTADFRTGVQDVDVVVLATPVRTILRLLAQLPVVRPDGCLVVDVGSTKTAVCRAMNQLPAQFAAIGGHPMCGREVAGFAAATPDLYRDKVFVLCRTERTNEIVEETALELVFRLGARPIFLEPERHDELVAAISHLPYLVSAALVGVVAAQHGDAAWSVAASGFRDSSRLAGSDPEMLLDILLTNKTAVLRHLQKYGEAVKALTQCLQANNEEKLRAWLKEVQQSYLAYRRAIDENVE
ncbi:MAG: prephenate dehydrogenase [Chloroflexi bacterium]|nr:MAG: prephenate dehydrogenase [Chloroflexota bacterium]